MWLIMEFTTFYMVFHKSFVPERTTVDKIPRFWYFLTAPLPLLVFPYLFIESQAWHIFLVFYAVVTARCVTLTVSQRRGIV